MKDNLDLLTIHEAADILKMHYQTVWLLVKSKEIPAVKRGRYWRIRRSDLSDYIGKLYGEGMSE